MNPRKNRAAAPLCEIKWSKAKNLKRLSKVKIEILGAKLSSSLSKKTNFLIAGIKPTLSKVQKAKDLGVRVFSEEEWNNFINE